MIGVAIAGRATAGKSTLASHLLPHGFVRVSFADALKAEVKDRFGVEKHHPGGRELLIRYGEEARRRDPWHWVKRLEPVLLDLSVRQQPFVIDDLRFRTEIRACQGWGLHLGVVGAPVALRRQRLASLGEDPDFATSNEPGESDHEAGTSWDWRVWNDGVPGSVAYDALLIARRVLRGLPAARLLPSLTG